MTYLLMVLKFLPAVIEAIAAIQKVMSDAPGEAKKAMIVDTVKETVKGAAGQVLSDKDAKILGDTVDSAVAVAKRFGVLGKTDDKSSK